jgi:hypothetical protein
MLTLRTVIAMTKINNILARSFDPPHRRRRRSSSPRAGPGAGGSIKREIPAPDTNDDRGRVFRATRLPPSQAAPATEPC